MGLTPETLVDFVECEPVEMAAILLKKLQHFDQARSVAEVDC